MTPGDATRKLLAVAATKVVAAAWAAIGAGADINAANDRQDTPLHLSIINGHSDLTELLIIFGANVNTRNDRMQTPLHLAAEYGRTEVARLLLENGAEVNSRDKWQRTPLHLASARGGNSEVVRVLLDKGADVYAQEDTGSTPLDWAHADNFKFLEDAGKHQLGHAGRVEKRREKRPRELGG